MIKQIVIFLPDNNSITVREPHSYEMKDGVLKVYCKDNFIYTTDCKFVIEERTDA